MKFGMMIQHRTMEVAGLLKFTSDQKQNCQQYPILCEIRIPVSTPLFFEPPAFQDGTKQTRRVVRIALCPPQVL